MQVREHKDLGDEQEGIKDNSLESGLNNSSYNSRVALHKSGLKTVWKRD